MSWGSRYARTALPYVRAAHFGITLGGDAEATGQLRRCDLTEAAEGGLQDFAALGCDKPLQEGTQPRSTGTPRPLPRTPAAAGLLP